MSSTTTTGPAPVKDGALKAPSLTGGVDEPPKQIAIRVLKRAALPALGLAVVCGVWEAIIRIYDVSVFLMPAPSGVFRKFTERFDDVMRATLTTGWEALLGLIFAVAIGIAVAIVLAYSTSAARLIYPYLIGIQVTPIVAIAPLLTIWFGFGLTPKVIVTFLVAFFPITVNFSQGLRSADPDMISLMKSLAASPYQIFIKIKVPSALPYLFAAFRIAAPATVVGAVVAEFISSQTGLGYMIIASKSALDTELLFVAMFGSALLGLLFFSAFALIERRAVRWHHSTNND